MARRVLGIILAMSLLVVCMGATGMLATAATVEASIQAVTDGSTSFVVYGDRNARSVNGVKDKLTMG